MASSFWSGEFYFDGEPSSNYQICIVDFNNNDILKQIGGGFTLSTEKDVSYNNRPFYMEKERALENIVLQLCRTDRKPWSVGDIIRINKWLFKKNFKQFQPNNQFYTIPQHKIIYYLKAIEMRKFLNPNMEGYLEVVFQPYNGYAYMIPDTPPYIKGNNGENGVTTKITSQSVMEDVYYPKIKIFNDEGDSNTNIIITNTTNGKTLKILGVNNKETITIDCAIGSVINSDGNNRFDVLENYDFIGLEKGDNFINLKGNAYIEFICEFPIII